MRPVSIETRLKLSMAAKGKKRGPYSIFGKNHKNWKGFDNIPKFIFTSCKRHAKNRNLLFEITIEDMNKQWLSQKGKCALTGRLLQFGQVNRRKHPSYKETTASMDRINSSNGYTKDNIQWINKDINQMKSDRLEHVFVELCNSVTNHNEYENIITPIDIFIKENK